MEDRRQSNTRLQSMNRLTSSTSKVGQRQHSCQNCGKTGECGCQQPIKGGSTGKIQQAPVKSPLKTLPQNHNVRQAARRASGKLQNPKPKTVAPSQTSTSTPVAAEPAQEDICLIHNKPLEVICRQDLTIICASCAIFGHKGHDFKSVNEFQMDKLKRCQDILELTDDRRVLEDKISGRVVRESMQQRFHKMKESLVDEAKHHFKKLMALVQSGQEKCIERILIAVTQEYDKLKGQLSVPNELLTRYRQWEVHAYQQIKAFQNDQNLELQMKMLNYDRKLQEDVVKKGNGLMSEFKLYLETLEKNIAEGLGCLTLSFPREVERKLERYADFSVKRRTDGHQFSGDINMVSSDDLLLNDSKEELDDEKDNEIQPTKKVLKMQEEMMKIEQEPPAISIITSPIQTTPSEVVAPLKLSPNDEGNQSKLSEISPRTTTDVNLSLPYSSRIVEDRRPTLLLQEQRSSILETRKNESYCPESSASCCVSPLYRPRATTFQPSKPMYQNVPPSTTLLPADSKSVLRIVTSPDGKLNSWPSVRSILSPSKYKDLTNEQRIKRVLLKLKLPEKYQKTVTSLMMEALEVLDLSNCSIDEVQIICVVELLKINRSVKILKLIRNRLTDDFVERILPFIGNIVTLNLSQNYLTQRSLDYIMAVTNQLPSLRHVVLSQNRIREKTCKGKLDELKKMNITVSF